MGKDAEPDKTDHSDVEKGDEEPTWAAEDPAVFGGSSTTQLPQGTVVEFRRKRGFRVIEKPEK